MIWRRLVPKDMMWRFLFRHMLGMGEYYRRIAGKDKNDKEMWRLAVRFIDQNPGCTLEELQAHLNVHYLKAWRIDQVLKAKKKIAWLIIGDDKYLHPRGDDGVIRALAHLYMQEPNSRMLVKYLVKNEHASRFWQYLVIARKFNLHLGHVMVAMMRLDQYGVLFYNRGERHRWEKGEHFDTFIQAAKVKLSDLDTPETREGDERDGHGLQKGPSKPENVNQTAS